MTLNEFHYTGSELDVFSTASNFKDYYLYLANSFIDHRSKVLEIELVLVLLLPFFLNQYHLIHGPV